MNSISRRDFLRFGSRLALLFGLGRNAIGALADALVDVATGQSPVLWLQGQSCSGCSISLLNSEVVTAGRLLTERIALQFHQTLSVATGRQAIDVANRTMGAGGYVLVVEGAVPLGLPKACCFGEETFGDQLLRATAGANVVLAVGTCAALGGIPAGEGNPTGAVSVPDFLARRGMLKPTIVIPGCPAHPDWVVGTIAHTLRFGVPTLDALKRPMAFFAKTVHEQCPRFPDYEREHFATRFGDEGCLFKLGCAGPITRADCTLRGWNGAVNHCIAARAPCVGCADQNFAARKDYPLYRTEEVKA